MITQLGNNITLVGNATQATIETVPTQDVYGSAYWGSYHHNSGRFPHIQWGVRDDLPNRKMKLLQDNPTKMQLVITSRNFVIGAGIGVFKNTFNVETGEFELKPFYSKAIEMWLRQERIQNYASEAAFQQAFSGNIFTNLSYNRRTNTASLRVKDVFMTRAKSPENIGQPVSSYLLNPQFGMPFFSIENNIPVAAYNPAQPQRHLESIWHGKDDIPGQPHYAFKPWWFTETWTQITDLIAQFHINGLKNGYNIKYHIRIPEEYYDKLGDTIEEREAAKDELSRNMDKWLAGVENVNKAMITHYLSEQYGTGKTAGIEIIELKNNLPDDAYTTLNETANRYQTSGHGVLPVLGGVDTGSKFGGSGSELRVAAQYHEDYNTYSDRHILTEPIRYAADMMGWDDDIVFWPKRILPIPTLDKIKPDDRKLN